MRTILPVHCWYCKAEIELESPSWVDFSEDHREEPGRIMHAYCVARYQVDKLSGSSA